MILVDSSLVPVLEELAPRLGSVRHYIVMGEGDGGSLPGALVYEELLAAQSPGFDYPELDECQAAGLCYTSGTTGTRRACSTRTARTSCTPWVSAPRTDRNSRERPRDAGRPMFHANAWGLPYGCALAGADLVMPGPDLSAPALSGLIAEERVTLAAGVPTIWMDLLCHADEHAP